MMKVGKEVLFLLFVLKVVSAYHHIISVDANGNDTLHCMESTLPCQSLEYVHDQLKIFANESILIEIYQPGINLTRALNFTSFVDFALQGKGGGNVSVYCNTSNAGLSFFGVFNLSISYLELSECGMEWMIEFPVDSISYKISALYVLYCCTVSITNMTISRSNGTGLFVFNSCEVFSISNTILKENKNHSLSHTKYKYDGGHGFVILQLNSTTAFDLFNQSCTSSSYIITDLHSIGNKAGVSNFLNRGPCGVGSGGGGYIVIATAHVSISISGSLFQGNTASCGGGLFISIPNHYGGNRITFSETHFIKNIASKNKVGGGVIVFYSLLFAGNESENSGHNTVNFTSCNFIRNEEGGVNLYYDKVSWPADEKMVFFTNCSWINNKATNYGPAVHAMAGTEIVSATRGHFPVSVFNKCQFIGHQIVPMPANNITIEINSLGVFYSNDVSVVFEGETKFINNSGTGLYLSSSIASFNDKSKVLFLNNSGTNGGAIALMGRSYLYMNGSSQLKFINNSATHLGGAVYFEGFKTIHYQPCFIINNAYEILSNFYFEGNFALGNKHGKHLYASSLNLCGISPCNATRPIDILNCLGNFTFVPSPQYAVGTYPTKFTLDKKLVTFYPGLSQQIDLIASDEEGHQIDNLTYQVTSPDYSTSKINVDPSYQYVFNNTIQVIGKPHSHGILQLNMLPTDKSLLINVSLYDCPPGYLHKRKKCICKANDYYGLLGCSPHVLISYGIWMGKFNGTLCTSDCPIGFCTYREVKGRLYVELPHNVNDLEEAICHQGREGPICGRCKRGYSVYYNSWAFQCKKDNKCHLGWFLFTLSAVIPITIFFLVVTLLDVNFTNGWNGLIFFAQIVTSYSYYGNGVIYYKGWEKEVLGWMLYFANFSRLEFFTHRIMEFCIRKGATFMNIEMVKLGIILYSLVLVFFFAFLFNQHRLVRCFPCLSRRRYTVINGISTFFIFCYAECVETCFRILQLTCIYDESGQCVKHVSLYSGDTDRHHNIYSYIIAYIFLLAVGVVPPFLLLFYPLFFNLLTFCKLSESKFALILWRIMPIQVLDSFQNPFKDKCRWYAGLYLLYRAIIFSLRLNLLLVNKYAAMALAIGVIFLLHAIIRPYKKRLYNVIDLLLMFDLALLNGIIQNAYSSFRGDYQLKTATKSTPFWTALEMVCLFIPLFCGVACILIKLAVKCGVLKILKKDYQPLP